MILDDIRQLKTGPRELRKFGLLVGGVFTALGILMWARGKVYFPWLLTPGAALILLGVLLPRILKPVYIAWMSVAFVLGFVVSHVILTLFFLLIITTTGLIARLFGKDFLGLRIERNRASYWLPRERTTKSESDYERQF